MSVYIFTPAAAVKIHEKIDRDCIILKRAGVWKWKICIKYLFGILTKDFEPINQGRITWRVARHHGSPIAWQLRHLMDDPKVKRIDLEKFIEKQYHGQH